jgi:hypothetical protein
MSDHTPFSPGYWRCWNVFRRLGGLWCALVGIGALAWTTLALVKPSLVPAESSTALHWVLAVSWLSMSAIAFGLSAWLLRSRTYRPDMGDHNWFASPQLARIERRENRNWWTGDPRRGA